MKTLKRVLGMACAAAMLLGMSSVFALEVGGGNAKERPALVAGTTMLATTQSGGVVNSAIPTQNAPIVARDFKLKSDLPIMTVETARTTGAKPAIPRPLAGTMSVIAESSEDQSGHNYKLAT